jgi:hypothetical protein
MVTLSPNVADPATRRKLTVATEVLCSNVEEGEALNTLDETAVPLDAKRIMGVIVTELRGSEDAK